MYGPPGRSKDLPTEPSGSPGQSNAVPQMSAETSTLPGPPMMKRIAGAKVPSSRGYVHAVIAEQSGDPSPFTWSGSAEMTTRVAPKSPAAWLVTAPGKTADKTASSPTCVLALTRLRVVDTPKHVP